MSPETAAVVDGVPRTEAPAARSAAAVADLVYRRVGRRTILERSFSTAPLRVPPPIELDGAAYTTLLNASGGVVAGDAFKHRIRLGPGAHVVLTTQSATRIYRSTGETARSSTAIRVGPDAVLEWVPDPVIPYAGSRYDQRLAVEVAAGGLAIVADAWAAGRLARGERWAFAAFTNEVCIDLAGRPAVRERYALDPGGAAALEGWPYVAAWYAVGGRSIDWDAAAARLADVVESFAPHAYGGATSLWCGAAVRLVAASSPALVEAGARVWDLLRRAALGAAPPALRKF